MPFVSLQSEAFPTKYFRGWNGQGWVDVANFPQDKPQATVELVPGFSDPTAVSIHSLFKPDPNGPEFYFRHWAFRLQVLPRQGPQFDGDFTFRIVPALSGTPGNVSIQSVNFPDKYVHGHGADNSMWLEAPDGSAGFKAEASWTPVLPLAPGLPTTWSDVLQIAKAAVASIPTPPAAPAVVPVSPAAQQLGVTQALQASGLPPVQAGLAALPQAFVQAAGGPSATNYLSSLLGVGLSGIVNGTGPLPGALGIAAQQLFGAPGVPSPMQYPTVRIILEAHPSFKSALNGTSGSLFSRLFGVKPTQVADFQGAFMDLAAMQHEDQFRASLLTLLRELVNSVSGGLGLGMPMFVPPPPLVTPVGPSFQGYGAVPTVAPTALSSLQAILGGSGAVTPGGQPVQPSTVVGSTSGAPIAAQPWHGANLVGSTVLGQPMAAIPMGVRSSAGAPPIVTPVGASSVPHFVGMGSAPPMVTVTPMNPNAPIFSGGQGVTPPLSASPSASTGDLPRRRGARAQWRV